MEVCSKESLNVVMTKEYEALNEMLLILEKQHMLLSKRNTMALEKCAEEVKNISKKLAQCEFDRRSVVKKGSIIEIINNSKDEELEEKFKKIKMLLNEITVQKESNELLIKQGLIFSSKMLNILNPDRSTKTYGFNGKIKK